MHRTKGVLQCTRRGRAKVPCPGNGQLEWVPVWILITNPIQILIANPVWILIANPVWILIANLFGF